MTVLLIAVYVNASVSDWWGGSSYGARRMTSLLPLVGLGVANLGLTIPRRVLVGLLVAVSLWGAVTANLYRSGVRDLSTVVLGRPSLAPGAERELDRGPDPVSARRTAFSFPLRYSKIDFFAGDDESPRSGRPLTAGIVLVSLVSMAWILRRVSSQRLLAGTLLGYLLLVLLSHLRLLSGPPVDPSERLRWAHVARQVLAGRPNLELLDAALERSRNIQGVARTDEALRFLSLFAFWQRGEMGRGQAALAGLRARGYPSIAALSEKLDLRAAPGGDLQVLMPYRFHAVSGLGQLYRVAVPGPDSWQDVLRVELDVHPGQLAGGGAHSLLTVRQGSRGLVSVGVKKDGDTFLGTRQAEATAPWSWRRMGYHLTLTLGAGEARLQRSHGGSLRVVIPPESTLDGELELRFGRPQKWRDQSPWLGLAYSNLRVVRIRSDEQPRL